MKIKKLTVLCIIIIVAVLYVLAMYIPIFPRIYKGNRIEGSIQISVNQKPIDIRSCNFDFYDTGNVSFYENTAHIALKGGEYGGYTITVTGSDFDVPITINIHQYNWHQITRFDMKADIVNESKICSVMMTESATTGETAEIWKQEYSKQVKAENGMYSIFAGG